MPDDIRGFLAGGGAMSPGAPIGGAYLRSTTFLRAAPRGPTPKELADEAARMAALRTASENAWVFDTVSKASAREPSSRRASGVRQNAMKRLRIVDISDGLQQGSTLSPDPSPGIAEAATRALSESVTDKHILDVQYNPEKVTETYAPHYETPSGAFRDSLQQGLIFLWNKPRTVKFTLFLNDWGDKRQSRSVQSDLTFLSKLPIAKKHPVTGGKWDNAKTGFQFLWRPPVVMVLWSDSIIGVVTEYVVEHIKWDPENLIPVRAKVSLGVSEQVFFPELATSFRSQAGRVDPVSARTE